MSFGDHLKLSFGLGGFWPSGRGEMRGMAADPPLGEYRSATLGGMCKWTTPWARRLPHRQENLAPPPPSPPNEPAPHPP
jgi:hypothetical protein